MRLTIGFVFAVLMHFCVSVCSAQGTQAIANLLARQCYEFPQEKVHVMTDRGGYLAGDTVWLRAWVVDAVTHQPVNASRFIYIDLLSPADTVMARVKIHSDNDGLFSGYLPLDVELPEGLYQLTAYTMFMQSAGEEYFYRQPLHVQALASMRQRIESRFVRDGNEVDVRLQLIDQGSDKNIPFKMFAYQSSDKRWHERRRRKDNEVRFTLKGDDANMPALLVVFDNYAKYIPLPRPNSVQVDFYPEGGYLVPDVENAMTYKVHATGTVHLYDGELLDSDGRVVAPLKIEHDGMGLIRFTPALGMTYKARWHDEMGSDLVFNLPMARNDATVVTVRNDEHGSIAVQTKGAHASNAILVAHQRGTLLTTGRGSITFNQDQLPSGVVQVLAFDNNWQYLSERLFFAGSTLACSPDVITDKPHYDHRERVKVNVDFSQLAPAGGNYAVSVTDNHVATTPLSDIRVDLLLQSDLRGVINAPEYYFAAADSTQAAERRHHLDMLMLTQGWRRYDIPKLMQGNIAQPQYPIEQAQVVTGRVLSDWRKKPVANASISAIAPRVAFSDKVVADSLGEFVIILPLIPDSVECVVFAENVKGKKQMNLELDRDTFPRLTYAMAVDSVQLSDMATYDVERLEKSGDWRHILLDEIIVTAPRRRLTELERDPFSLEATDITRKGIRSVEALTYVLPGLMVYNGNLYTTGGNPRDQVSIIVDGENVAQNFTDDHDILKEIAENASPFEREALRLALDSSGYRFSRTHETSDVTVAQSMISFPDVAYVHFARGYQGHGGMLIVQHKKGFKGVVRQPSRYLQIAHPTGAQQPAQFYSPRYETPDQLASAPGTDLRNLLYWNPAVNIESDMRSSFDFYTSDAPSTYTITLQGVTPSGTPFRATRQVEKAKKE